MGGWAEVMVSADCASAEPPAKIIADASRAIVALSGHFFTSLLILAALLCLSLDSYRPELIIKSSELEFIATGLQV